MIVWFGCWMATGALLADDPSLQPFRLGYFPNLTHAQAVIARDSDDWANQLGVPIQWIPFNAGPSAIEAIFAGAIDATFIGPSPTINGYAKSKGEVFCVVAGSASGGAALVVRPGSGIQGAGDFHDKIMATPQLGNTQDVAARWWLKQQGYRLAEKGGTVRVIPTNNADQMALMAKKELDAAWTIEPWVSRMEMAGCGRILLEEKSLWPDGRYVTTHLIVRRALLEKRADLVRRLLKAHVKLTQELQADPQAAAERFTQAFERQTGQKIGVELVARAMGRVELTWDPLAETLMQSAEHAVELGLLRSRPSLTGLYDLTLLNEVLSQMNQPLIQPPK